MIFSTRITLNALISIMDVQALQIRALIRIRSAKGEKNELGKN